MKKENEGCLFLVRFESLCDNKFSLLKQYSKISLAVHNKYKRTYPGTYLSIGVEENVRIFNSNRTRHLPCRFTSGMNLREFSLFKIKIQLGYKKSLQELQT